MLYKSAHGAKQQNKTIEKSLSKQTTAEVKAVKKVMQTPFYCEADANEALEALKKKCQYIEIISTALIQKLLYSKRGRPKKGAVPDGILFYREIVTATSMAMLQQQIDEQSGRFILATNDPDLSPQALLDAYKSQQRVERGFRSSRRSFSPTHSF